MLSFLPIVDGVWKQWTAWDTCTVTCGGGKQNRTRACKEARHGGLDCDGVSVETQYCNDNPCPGEDEKPFICIFKLTHWIRHWIIPHCIYIDWKVPKISILVYSYTCGRELYLNINFLTNFVFIMVLIILYN